MRIENGLVYREDGAFHEETVRIRGPRFSAFCDDMDRLDASGCYVLPGLLDMHLHGAHGAEFSDGSPSSLTELAQYEAAHGVTSIVPTTMTLPRTRLEKIADSMAPFQPTERSANVLGMRLEGPFLSAEKCGSQETSCLCLPDASLVKELQERSGNQVAVVDLAPELPGAIDFIDEVKPVRVSIAHTAADYNTARTAIRHGASHLTHMYNAMAPFAHRAPGPIGAASDEPGCTVELIADGVHNHPSMVRNAFRIFGADRICLISDSMRATGMPDGTYEFGGHEVRVEGKRALLKDGTIAASVTNLYDCMVTCIRDMHIPVEQAVRCASLNPARYLGVSDRVGSIALGKQADLILVDRYSLALRGVLLRGEVLWTDGIPG